jgi:hypothetical protein
MDGESRMMGAIIERGPHAPWMDVGAAVLAAVGAAAAILLIPTDLLESIVLQSGLPSLLPAAEPPLGMTARLALAVVAAAVAGLAVFATMRLLARAASLFEEEDEEDGPVAATAQPRVRRRDQHPDAPARAPLSAHRDLGAPEPPPPPVIEEEPARRIRKRMATEIGGDAPWRQEEAVGERLRRIQVAQAGATVTPQPAPEAETELLLETESPAAADVAADLPEPAEPTGFAEDLSPPEPASPVTAWPSAEAEPSPLAWRDWPVQPVQPVQASRSRPVEESAEQPLETPPTPAEPPVSGRESVDELVARLERAIERRRAGAPSAIAAPPPATPVMRAPGGESMDERLRAALDSLKRFAPSHA